MENQTAIAGKIIAKVRDLVFLSDIMVSKNINYSRSVIVDNTNVITKTSVILPVISSAFYAEVIKYSDGRSSFNFFSTGTEDLNVFFNHLDSMTRGL